MQRGKERHSCELDHVNNCHLEKRPRKDYYLEIFAFLFSKLSGHSCLLCPVQRLRRYTESKGTLGERTEGEENWEPHAALGDVVTWAPIRF